MYKLHTSFLLLTVAVAVFCCSQPDSGQAGRKVYGEAISVADTTAISVLQRAPELFVGNQVLVSGTISDVCPHKGCWIDIRDRAGQTIRVKVQDDVIVFPVEAKGKTVAAQGVVEKLELDRQQLVRMKQHEAEERGQPFEPGSIQSGETIYRIQGSGAVILDQEEM